MRAFCLATITGARLYAQTQKKEAKKTQKKKKQNSAKGGPKPEYQKGRVFHLLHLKSIIFNISRI